MSILFIGKRYYTNRDALNEKYGRIYQLPLAWSKTYPNTKLWLIDYHGYKTESKFDGALDVLSTPVRNFSAFLHGLSLWKKPSRTYHTVVASGDCYIGWVGMKIARKIGAQFVFDVYDKYDEFAGYKSPPGLPLFPYLLKNADARLFASQGLMKSLGKADNDLVVANGLDTSVFKPLDMQASRREMNLPERISLVGYFGSMEEDRGIADLIDAVNLLRSRGTEVKLVLGGKATSGLNLQQESVHYLGNVPYEKMAKALASCDLLALPYRRSPIMDAGSSNKIAEAISCGRPIVATRTPNLTDNFPVQARQLEKTLANPSDPESLANSIRIQLKERISVELPDEFSWESISTRIAGKLFH